MIFGATIGGIVGDPVIPGLLYRNIYSVFGIKFYVFDIDLMIGNFSVFLKDNDGLTFDITSPYKKNDIIQDDAAVFMFFDNGIDELRDSSGGLILNTSITKEVILRKYAHGFPSPFFGGIQLYKNDFNFGRFKNAY
jgi:hypothetical protein